MKKVLLKFYKFLIVLCHTICRVCRTEEKLKETGFIDKEEDKHDQQPDCFPKSTGK